MLKSMDEIREASDSTWGHWFDADTMRFFETRLSFRVYATPYGTYFVSSELMPGWESRRYSLRFCALDGRIWTVGEFGEYPNRAAAHKAARRYLDPLVKRPKG